MGNPERWKGHTSLPEDLDDRIDRIVERLRKAGADLVYLFGSAARRRDGEGEAGGEEPAPRDVDLAVLGLEADYWRTLSELTLLLGTDRIDLVRLESAPPELRFSVVRDGELLYAAGPDVENRFETGVLRRHHDRAPVRRLQWEYLRRRIRARANRGS